MSARKKLKTLLTRVITFTLALTMTITPLSTMNQYTEHVHAEQTQDSADNQGGGEGSMGYSDSVLAWSQYYQGYRFYVINKNLERISPVYDFYFSTPIAGEYLRTTRFDTANSPVSGTLENMYNMSVLMQWCNTTTPVPTPTKKVGEDRVGNGTEFKKWFFAGEKGNSIDGGGSSSGGSSNEAPDDWVTPEIEDSPNYTEPEDPWAGDGTVELEDLGDGGDLISDGMLNP